MGRAEEIDWLDPHGMVTEHFSVHDCLSLGKWARMANEQDGLTLEIKKDIIKTCELAEEIRNYLGRPMVVTSMYRPKSYAKVVRSTDKSPHCFGLAMDFVVLPHSEMDAAKVIIRNLLEPLKFRMEFGTNGWIHIDRHAPGMSGREFIP